MFRTLHQRSYVEAFHSLQTSYLKSFYSLQISSLEALHSLIMQFAPKLRAFSFPEMMCGYLLFTGLCTTIVFFSLDATGECCATFLLRVVIQRLGACNYLPVVLLPIIFE